MPDGWNWSLVQDLEAKPGWLWGVFEVCLRERERKLVSLGGGKVCALGLDRSRLGALQMV